VQYACAAYVECLTVHCIAISMSRVANPYDNAKPESFMKTLKTDEVNRKQYTNFEHARRDIGQFIESVYNTQRLHSAPGYKPPVECETELRHSVSH
jgi:transposase InsO family protein